MLLTKTKFILFFMAVLIHSGRLIADSLDIYSCFKSAELLSPLKKQEALLLTGRDLNQKNISTGYLPELTIAGKATYQSDVFTFPISNPLFDIPVIPKDQYQATLNLRENIYDAGTTHNLHDLEEAKTTVSQNQLSADLYQTREIVSQLYFSILILQENLKTVQESKATLESQQKSIQSGVEHGAVLPSVLYVIQKELLNIDQNIIQLTYDRATSLKLLSTWIGHDLNDSTTLVVPALGESVLPAINRPEIRLFDSQKQVLESNKALSHSKQLPFLYAFAQGGYARPNPFNFFETKFSDFYLIGLQLNWKPFNWGYEYREKQVLEVQEEEIAAKKEDFIRNLSMALEKDRNESRKLAELIRQDDEIISLQKKIAEQYFSQLQHGVITPTEYLTEFNALTNAQINKKIHHIQLSQAFLNMLIQYGNINQL